MRYKNNIKFILCLLYGMTSILKIWGQTSAIIDCTNKELVTSIFNDPIDLTLRGIIKVYKNVTVNEILATTNNEFQVNYIDARLENSNTSDTKNLILHTSEHFENYAKEQTSSRISLKINLGCGKGKERVIIFFQPLKEANYYSPIFSRTNYELFVPTPIFVGFDLTAFLEITAKDDDLTHNQILFTSNDSLTHYITVGTKNTTSADKKTYFANLILERILLELAQPIQFQIIATDKGEPSKSSAASVVIRPDPRRSLPPRPKFTETLYKGYINLDLNMQPIQIQLSNGTYTPEVECSLNGVDIKAFKLQDNKNGSVEILWNPKNLNKREILKRKSWQLVVEAQHQHLAEMGSATILVELADVKSHALYFEVKQNLTTKSVDIVLKNQIPAFILATTHLLNMTLTAFIPGLNGLNDTLMVFIELPIKECPKPTTPTTNPPQFSSNNYVFTVYTNQTGILGVVNAFNKDDSNARLQYILDVSNEMLAETLAINPFNGELTLYGIIAEGNYPFNITAENIETGDRTVMKALLKVHQKEECKMFEGVAVEKTLMIMHVDEEKPNYGLLDLKFNENCTFHIVDMWPHDKEYVHVNYIFNMLDAIPIDREDEIFENMTEAQVMVKLRLECNLADKQQNLTIDIPKPEVRRGTQITFNEDIPYSPDIMWLYLKIDDINDNAPQFKISEGPIYLGYPAGISPLAIYPEYLTQIETFDRDLGYNAAIVYGMTDNPYFGIERKTGKIYPTGKALGKDQQMELIISATDQYGEGLVSHTIMVIRGLSPDFYSLITLKENSAKEKQQLEDNLSQATGYDINILKMSYVPQEAERRTQVMQNFSCKAWIYAFDKHQLLTCKEIQQHIFLKNPATNTIVNIETYDEATLHSSPRENANLGYLIAIISLSVVSCTSLTFIIWRYCYKPATATKCDTKKTASSSLVGTRNGSGNQQFDAECPHGFDYGSDCTECGNDANQNHVKFSDLVENRNQNENVII